MGEFRMAGAYVEARLDRTKLDASITKLKREEYSLKVRADFDAKAADARIAALVKTRRMKVGVDLDAKAATAGLGKLTADRRVQITARLDSKMAAAGLLKTTKDRKVRILADLDTKAATAGLQKLTRARTVPVKVKLDATAMKNLTGKKFDAQIVAKINDAAYDRTKAKLDKLTADRIVRILATADTRVAADEIRNLTRRQRVRIGLDVDTRVAAADIANLTRRRMVRVVADADTAAAAARLAALSRPRTALIRVRTLGGLGGLGGGLGSAAGSAGMLSSRILAIGAAALAALPAVASLGQAIAQMGPAAAVAIPALGSLITLGAALAVGLKGMGGAFKAAFEPAKSSAGAAASSLRAVESAQLQVARSARSLKEAQQDAARQIADAQERVKEAAEAVRDAEVQAARDRKAALQRVADAERDLADAQEDATRAQEDLNEARQTETDRLEDLENRLATAGLDQRDAVMDVADAQKELDALKAKGAAANQEDLARAQLDYERAVQRLKEQQLETERLQEESAEAAVKGVEGSDAVRDAQERLGDAQRTVGDKAQAVGQAQADAAQVAADGADRVRDAQEALADAQQGVADAQVAAARQVRGAQEALADAQRSVADAMASGATQTDKFGEAMAKLAPNARSFVEAVKAIAPAWSAVRMDVQNALFRGLDSTLVRMSAATLPAVRGGLVGMAGVLNGMGRGLMDTFTRLADAGLLKRMFDGFTNGMRPMQKVPGQIAEAFVKLSIAAAPAFQRLTEAASRGMSGVVDSLTKGLESGAIERAIGRAIDVMKDFGSFLGDVFGTLNNILDAAATGGGDALGVLGAVFEELRRVTAMPEMQEAMASMFKAVNAIAGVLATSIGRFLEAMLPALQPVFEMIAQMLTGSDSLLPVLGLLLLRFNPILGVMVMLAPIIGKLMTALAPLIETVVQLAEVFLTALQPVIDMVLDVIVLLVGQLAAFLVPIMQALMPVIGLVADALMPLLAAYNQFYLALLPLLPAISQLIVALVELAVQVLTPLVPIITLVATQLSTVLAGALGILVPVLTTVIGWLTKLTEGVTKVVEWVVDKFQWLYDKLVGHSIIPDLVKEIIRWFTSLFTTTKKIFNQVKDAIVGAFSATWKTVRGAWNTAWTGLRGAFSTAWKWVRDSVSNLKTSVTNTWSTMWNGARDKASAIFRTIRDKVDDFRSGVGRAFTLLRDGIGRTWDGIKSKLATPVRWVIGNVYNSGIRKMWNTIAGKISSKITLPAIGLKFAKGGIVPGTGTKDTVPAMLTPNERVLSLAQVAKLGGHRAIDAALGEKRDQGKTGGDPDVKTAQKMQGARGFDEGGIVGAIADVGSTIGGAVKGAVDWTKDIFVGGLRAAASKAISAVVRPLINRIPMGSGGFSRLIKGVPNNLLDKMLGWLGNEDKKAVGGAGVQKALSWVRTQHGLPYQWGGNGNPSWDCSGLVSAVESVIRGQSPHRRWATGSFSGGNAPSGWVRNLVSPYMIGITHAGVGHTAGTIGGVNIESRGGDGVLVGSRARGYRDNLFTSRYGFQPATKFDDGGLLAPGRTLVHNATGRPERVLDPRQTAIFEEMVANLRSGGGVRIENVNISGSFDFASPAARKAAARELVAEIKEELRKYDRERA